MKNKKLLLCLSLTLLTSCKHESLTLYLGENIEVKDVDFIEELENTFSCNINHEFMSSRFYMKNFYNMLEKDALNLSTSNSISSLLENTNRIILNIGNYELIRLIEYDEISLTYDEQVFKTSLEMFEYYLHNSLEILTSYCKDITIIPLYNSLLLEESIKVKYNYLINQYNEIIFNNCNEFNVKYTSIDKLSYFVYKDNAISEAGLTYLIKKINEGYGSS